MSTLSDNEEEKKNDGKDRIVLPAKLIEGFVKSEVNLERLPFFAPTKREAHATEEISFTRKAVRDNMEISVKWQVRPHGRYGLPNAFDRDIYRAIQELINQKGILPGNLVPFTYREICRLLGASYGSRMRDQVKQSLRRMRATEVESRGAFRLKGSSGKAEDGWVNDVFSIFGRIIETGQTLPDGTVAETNFLELGSWYVQSICNGYLKTVDLRFYRSLSSPLAKFLYSYLDVVFFPITQANGDAFRKRYRELCEELLLVPQKYKSDVMKILSPAIQELRAEKYLADFALEEIAGIKGDWLCVFVPGERYLRPQQFNPMQLSFLLEADNSIASDTDSSVTTSKRHDAETPNVELTAEDSRGFRLVMDFHERAKRPKHRPTKKEIHQAEELLAQFGEDGARQIVNMAFEQAPKTNFDMKRFGAIDFFAKEYAHSLKFELPERLKEQGRVEAENRALRAAKDHFEAHKALCFATVSGHKRKIGPEAWSKRVRQTEEDYLAANEKVRGFIPDTMLGRIAEQEARKAVLPELGVPSWEDYAKEKGIDPKLIAKVAKDQGQ